MNTVDATTLADLAIFTPLTILPALKKDVPEPLILAAFLYTSVRALTIVHDLVAEKEQEKIMENNSLKRLDTFTVK